MICFILTEICHGRRLQIPMKKLARPLSRLYTTSSTTTTALKQKRIPNDPVSIDSIKELHAHLIRTHSHRDPYAISPVIKSYALSPSYLHRAHLLFNQLDHLTLYAFNQLLRGLSYSDKPSEAIDSYCKILSSQGLSGDNLTYIYLFKACGRVKDVLQGQVFHVHALKSGFGLYLFVCNALISMYGCFGDLFSAQKVFDEMGERDLVSWNSLICCYSQCSRYKEVLSLFNLMQEDGMEVDGVTMVKVMLACKKLGDWDFADSVAKCIEDSYMDIDVYLGNTLIDMYGRRGSLCLATRVFHRMKERNVVSWNALIAGYAKVGNLGAARELFCKMPVRNVVSWSSMITGYAQAKRFSEAVEFFKEMVRSEVKPDKIILTSVLSACAGLGSLEMGMQVHENLSRHGIVADVFLHNALIDMYCKCGEAGKALEVFLGMEEKDSVSWTSIISGLAVNGFAEKAVELFSQMLRDGVQPTHGNFMGVLLACTYTGQVDKGLEYFESMEKVYGLTPEMKHYGCVVDLLSRSGDVSRAYQIIEAMPMAPNGLIWRILLAACKLHGNLALAEIAANKLLELDPDNSGNFVLLSNTYAGFDRWEDVAKTRAVLVEKDLQMPFAWSSIEVQRETWNSTQAV